MEMHNAGLLRRCMDLRIGFDLRMTIYDLRAGENGAEFLTAKYINKGKGRDEKAKEDEHVSTSGGGECPVSHRLKAGLQTVTGAGFEEGRGV